MENAGTDTYNPSSPHSSSGGAESLKGTPDTRLTAFSPEEGSTKSSRLLKPPNVRSIGIAPILFPVKSPRCSVHGADKDPFVTPKSTASSQLSPTASAFHPLSTWGSVPAEKPPSTKDSTTPSARNPVIVAGISGQIIRLSYADRDISVASATSYLERLERFGLLAPGFREIAYRDKGIFVRFHDADSVARVVDNARRYGEELIAALVPDSEWPDDAGIGVPSHGRVSIMAYAAFSPKLDVQRTEASIHDLLQSQGELISFHGMPNVYGPSVYTALADFVLLDNAIKVVTNYDGCSIEGAVVHLAVAQMDPRYGPSATANVYDLGQQDRMLSCSLQNLEISKQTPSAQAATQQDRTSTGLGNHYPGMTFQMQPSFGMWPFLCQTPLQPNLAYVLDGHQHYPHTVRPALGNYQLAAPTLSRSGHMVHVVDGYCQPRSMPGLARPDSRRLHASRVSRSSFYNMASHHNHVDVTRIREGIDVRTTIMLRNIPNKVDQSMLKRIVDESSWGKYDFMYLRIDFANDCNVGYAFINFVDPLDIIDFVNARGNQRWNCFKSDKVAEISYATIQGKDCLVQKFRNSSVMLEAAHCRPKLYYTSNGPIPDRAGQEEAFPAPDNQSKMKRSCENAEHVGLFTPNAGQHFRDEQRRRRSQYDRGTRLAALEEQDFEAAARPYVQYQQ